MLGCGCLLSVVFAFHCFDGVLLQELSRNAKYGVNDPTDEISLGGGGGGWGLPDSIAVVGKIFRYQLLTHDDTCGNLTNYQIAARDNGALPAWLLFNKTESALEGVPGSSDSGQVHSIQVTATCTGSTVPFEEHFTITVSDKEEKLERKSPAFFGSRQNAVDDDVTMLVRCGADGAVTTATVTIDADDSRLTSVDRLLLLRRLGSRLGLPETLLRLAADQRPIFDDGPLVAGPGDAKHPTGPGLAVQWDVGCGNVFARHMPVLQLLETASVNGSLSAAVGHGVVGWDVSSKRSVQTRSKRRVYFAYPTATPLPSAERPSARPGPTAIVPDKGTPETRIVPTRTSVGVPGVTRTSTPPSRSKDIVSPAVRLTKSPTPTTTYVTITATRVLSSVTGTTLGPGGGGGVTAAARNGSSTPGLIEPSIVSETPLQPGSTDVLPTWTTSSSSKLPTPRATKRPPKTQKPPATSRFTTPQQADGAFLTLKPLDDIEVPMGRQVLVKLPDDLFRDYGTIVNLYIEGVNEDGSTSALPPSWISVNRTSRTLYGLPLEEDHIGTHRLELVAIDDQGRTIVTPLTVRIDPPLPEHEASNEFSVTFDLDYDQVANDLETRVNLINKIAAAFGDKDAGKMTILEISPGSVVIKYTNNTLPSDPCPQKEIEALLRYLLLPDGQINETFAKAMEPYRVLKAEGKATGSCASSGGTDSIVSSPAPSVTSQVKVTTSTPEEEVNVKPAVYKSDSNLLYILVPLLIFFVLLVLVIIICIVCCKRQRKRQAEEDKLTGLHKGIPIIFADELEDKQDTPASTLKSRTPDDEKRDQQHVPPPEYPTWKSSGSGSSTLRSDYKSPLLTDNEDEENKDDESTPPETLPRKRTLEENASTTEPLLQL